MTKIPIGQLLNLLLEQNHPDPIMLSCGGSYNTVILSDGIHSSVFEECIYVLSTGKAFFKSPGWKEIVEDAIKINPPQEFLDRVNV